MDEISVGRWFPMEEMVVYQQNSEFQNKNLETFLEQLLFQLLKLIDVKYNSRTCYNV